MKQKDMVERRAMAEGILAGIDDKFIEEAMNYNGEAGETLRAKQVTFKKRAWKLGIRMAACLALLTVISFSSLSVATASGSVKAYEYLYKLNPYLAERMTPVEKTCVDQGIEMKVAGIYVHGEIMDIFITMQDIEGDRIDDTTDLFDSYSINVNCDQWGGCTLVDYDEETKTATFQIMMGLYDHKIEGKKMTFSVKKFLSAKQQGWKDLPEIDLGKVSAEKAEYLPEAEVAELLATKLDMGYPERTSGLPKLLVPNDAQTISVADGMKVTAYGMVDGKLHVQVYYEDVKGRDDNGDVQLLDENGMEHVRSVAAYLQDKDHKGRYEEYEFDVPADELSNYSVIAYYSTGAKLYEGDWKITFPFTNVEELEKPLSGAENTTLQD